MAERTPRPLTKDLIARITKEKWVLECDLVKEKNRVEVTTDFVEYLGHMLQSLEVLLDYEIAEAKQDKEEAS